MKNFEDDQGRKLRIKPRLLLVGNQNSWAAKDILDRTTFANGESNIYHKLIPWESIDLMENYS